MSPAAARKLIREIVATGKVSYSQHAKKEMANDGLEITDVVNVLRGGWVEPAEEERGTYRYRVCTRRMCVVVAFRSETELRVVTAWRIKS